MTESLADRSSISRPQSESHGQSALERQRSRGKGLGKSCRRMSVAPRPVSERMTGGRNGVGSADARGDLSPAVHAPIQCNAARLTIDRQGMFRLSAVPSGSTQPLRRATDHIAWKGQAGRGVGRRRGWRGRAAPCQQDEWYGRPEGHALEHDPNSRMNSPRS